MRLKKVINIFGGPGAGKSVLAADIWVHLKKMGYNAELITEYAKMLTYECRHNVLTTDQLYVFAKQHRKLLRLKDTVDYIVCDSPLVQGIMYMDQNSEAYNAEHLKCLMQSTFNAYPNFNIFLERSGAFEYQTVGRNQTEEQARAIDAQIREFLIYHTKEYYICANDAGLTESIVQKVLQE